MSDTNFWENAAPPSSDRDKEQNVDSLTFHNQREGPAVGSHSGEARQAEDNAAVTGLATRDFSNFSETAVGEPSFLNTDNEDGSSSSVLNGSYRRHTQPGGVERLSNDVSKFEVSSLPEDTEAKCTFQCRCCVCLSVLPGAMLLILIFGLLWTHTQCTVTGLVENPTPEFICNVEVEYLDAPKHVTGGIYETNRNCSNWEIGEEFECWFSQRNVERVYLDDYEITRQQVLAGILGLLMVLCCPCCVWARCYDWGGIEQTVEGCVTSWDRWSSNRSRQGMSGYAVQSDITI